MLPGKCLAFRHCHAFGTITASALPVKDLITEGLGMGDEPGRGMAPWFLQVPRGKYSASLLSMGSRQAVMTYVYLREGNPGELLPISVHNTELDEIMHVFRGTKEHSQNSNLIAELADI